MTTIFSRIIAGEIPGTFVYRDDRCVAFMSINPLARGHVLAWPRHLDLEPMNEAGRQLLGEHDFASFCKKREGATTIRTLLDVSWARVDGVAEVTVRADAFCHNMVRSLVGCLLAVGEGRHDPAWPVEVLSRRQRDSAVTVVQAHGLTLEEVGYPPDEELAGQAERSRVVRTLAP
jgi:tRNA pseudouridine38-40 synthase